MPKAGEWVRCMTYNEFIKLHRIPRLLNMFAAKYRKDKGLPALQESEYLPE